MALSSIQQRFDRRGSNPRAQKSPDGAPWVGRKPSTIRIAKQFGMTVDPALLLSRDDGELRNAIQIVTGDLSRVATRRKGVIIGIPATAVNAKGHSLETIGFAHQEGAAIKVFGKGSATLPARPFMGLDRALEGEIQQVLKQDVRASGPLRGALRGARGIGGGLQSVINRIIGSFR